MISFYPAQSTFVFPRPFGSMLQEPYGWAPMLGFTIINLIWQFSDYTAYHRISLLALPSSERERVRHIEDIT